MPHTLHFRRRHRRIRPHVRARSRDNRGGVPCLLAPFVALGRMITGLVVGIISLTGRFVAMLIGFVFIVVGLLVSLTVVGAIIGIPLALFGLLLIVRGLA